MAISTVRVQLEGSWYNLNKQSDGSWQTTLTAPNKTSFGLSGGSYELAVEAANEAGTKGSGSIQLVVKERIAPVITIVSPGDGAYVANSKQSVVFTVVDETGGSGVNMATLSVVLDGVAQESDTLATSAITNGYSVTFTPVAAMADGAHTLEINVSDNDGNAATAKSLTFTVDTVPPVLVLTSPQDSLITATAQLAVSGSTNDATSSPVTLNISLNGNDQGAIGLGSSGTFSKTVTLAEGENTIVVVATDAAGRTTEISRTVMLDSTVPKIVSAIAAPNPVDAGATMNIVVVVE